MILLNEDVNNPAAMTARDSQETLRKQMEFFGIAASMLLCAARLRTGAWVISSPEPERTARTKGVSHATAAQIFVLCVCCSVGRGARDRPDTCFCRRRARHNRDGLRS